MTAQQMDVAQAYDVTIDHVTGKIIGVLQDAIAAMVSQQDAVRLHALQDTLGLMLEAAADHSEWDGLGADVG
jgi:hypothetical protein